MRSCIKNFIQFIFGVPLTAISLYFMFSFIYSSRSEILPYIGNVKTLPLLSGIVSLLVFFLLRSLSWKELVERYGYKLNTRESIYLLALSEIKRYIPGSIFGFVARIGNFNKLNIPSKIIVRLIFFESAVFLVSSLIVSIPGAFFLLNSSSIFTSKYYLVLPILFIFVFVLSALGIVVFENNKKNSKSLIFKLPSFGKPFLLMLSSWIFFGIGNYLIAVSFYYLDPNRFLELSSLFVLSWLIGYIVLIVPLGLGVREAVVFFGLSILIPAPLAAALSVISRVGLIAAELLFVLISYVLYKFKKITLNAPNHLVILWSSICLYVAYFSFVSIQKHLNFFSGKFDLGNMDQTVWNTINGRIFMFTNPDGVNTISRLAFHADFILVLLAPLYLLWNDARMLLIFQTVVLGLGAYFVYKISNFVLKNSDLSLMFSISYLLNPFIQKQNLFDFHPVVLATTFLLAAFYYVLVQRYYLFMIFILLSVLTKENVYLVAFLFGIYLVFKTKNRAWILLSAGSLSIFYIIVSKLIPLVRGGAHFAVEYFSVFGDTLPEVIGTAAFNPLFTIYQLLNPPNISYLIALFAPVGFLSLAASAFLIFAGPDLAINLLSNNGNLRDVTFHYGAVIIPFLYISAIYGARTLLKLKIFFLTTRTIIIILLFSSIYSTYQLGALPGSRKALLEIYTDYLPQRSDIRKFLSSVPEDLSVAASNNLGAHLSHREKLFIIPQGVDDADLIILLLNDTYATPSLSYQANLARSLTYNGNYIEVLRIGQFVAFSKREGAYRIPNIY